MAARSASAAAPTASIAGARNWSSWTTRLAAGAGSRLQLPVYAAAARAALGAPDSPVSAEYWFLRRDPGRLTLPLTDAVQAAFLRALTVITDGISAGLFPHRPAPETGRAGYVPCAYCDPDGLGTQGHHERWARKRHDPRLAAYLSLVEPS
jgi:ATP-dependent helicase/nuclease subunit B